MSVASRWAVSGALSLILVAPLRAQEQEFRVAIKEVDMLFWTQQAHMFALTMDIDQPAGYLLEYLLRVGPAIDAGYGTPGTEDIA